MFYERYTWSPDFDGRDVFMGLDEAVMSGALSLQRADEIRVKERESTHKLWMARVSCGYQPPKVFADPKRQEQYERDYEWRLVGLVSDAIAIHNENCEELWPPEPHRSTWVWCHRVRRTGMDTRRISAKGKMIGGHHSYRGRSKDEWNGRWFAREKEDAAARRELHAMIDR